VIKHSDRLPCRKANTLVPELLTQKLTTTQHNKHLEIEIREKQTETQTNRQTNMLTKTCSSGK